MNKTITIYELLGLVKDRKQPKRIKYYDEIYTYDNYMGDSGYVDKTVEPYKWFVKECDIERDLNDTIEIIEDNDKLEKIKWDEKESRAGILRTDQEIEVLARRTETLKKKITELVDHINKIEKKLDEK